MSMSSKRILKSFIDDLISRVSITQTIDECVPLKKTGKNYSACCPFHSEKTPSFTVTESKGFYNCFGCGANGNAIQFIQEFERVDFVTAINILADKNGMTVEYEVRNNYLEAKENEKTQFIGGLGEYFIDNKTSKNEKFEALSLEMGFNNETKNKLSYSESSAKIVDFISDNELTQAAKNSGTINKYGKLISYSNSFIYPIINKNKPVGFVCFNEKEKQLTIPGNLIFNEANSLVDLDLAKNNKNEQPIFIVFGIAEKIRLEELGVENVVCNVINKSLLTKSQYMSITKGTDKNVFFVFNSNDESASSALDLVESFVSGWRATNQSDVKVLFIPSGESLSSIVKKISVNNLPYLYEKAVDLPTYFTSSIARQAKPNKEISEPLLTKSFSIISSSSQKNKNLHGVLMSSVSQALGLEHGKFTKQYNQYLLKEKPTHWFINEDTNSNVHSNIDESLLSKSYYLRTVDLRNYIINEYERSPDDSDVLLAIESAIYSCAVRGLFENQDVRILKLLNINENRIVSALSSMDLDDENKDLKRIELGLSTLNMGPLIEGDNVFNEHIVDELYSISFDKIKSRLIQQRDTRDQLSYK
jgi:DNA primase